MSTEHVFSAHDIATAPGVEATTPGVTVRCCGQHDPGDRLHGPNCPLTAAFGARLRTIRRAAAGPAPNTLQCCRRPAIEPAARPYRTALPHLLAVRHHDQIRDHTVWEIIDRAVLRAWLPRADDPDDWRERVGQLQRLRVWLRSDTDTSEDALVELRARLRGRYLSMKFVLEHPGVVTDALAVLTERTAQRADEQDSTS
jgi:hypothetical protein